MSRRPSITDSGYFLAAFFLRGACAMSLAATFLTFAGVAGLRSSFDASFAGPLPVCFGFDAMTSLLAEIAKIGTEIVA